MTNEEKNKAKAFSRYDNETRKYIMFMCNKGCSFYDLEKGCTKNRVVRECVKKGLKNKE